MPHKAVRMPMDIKMIVLKWDIVLSVRKYGLLIV